MPLKNKTVFKYPSFRRYNLSVNKRLLYLHLDQSLSSLVSPKDGKTYTCSAAMCTLNAASLKSVISQATRNLMAPSCWRICVHQNVRKRNLRDFAAVRSRWEMWVKGVAFKYIHKYIHTYKQTCVQYFYAFSSGSTWSCNCCNFSIL